MSTSDTHLPMYTIVNDVVVVYPAYACLRQKKVAMTMAIVSWRYRFKTVPS